MEEIPASSRWQAAQLADTWRLSRTPVAALLSAYGRYDFTDWNGRGRE